VPSTSVKPYSAASCAAAEPPRGARTRAHQQARGDLARVVPASQDAAVSFARSAFLDSAAVVADLVDRVPPSAWDGPGLGEWDLRALVGHTSRSLVTVATYLQSTAETEDISTAEGYYVLIASAASVDPAAVVERGRAAGAALGDDPASAFRARIDDAAAALDTRSDHDLVPTIAGGMRVGAYLMTRVVELVVHGGDISTATGLPVSFPPAVLAETAALVARVAVGLGHGPVVLAALTGRAALPPGFSVV
jgi:uncharacterized protein (TIGR03083 family)